MKKIILSTISLAALAILGSSCQKQEAQTEVPATEGKTVLVSVAAENDGTKATEAGNVFLWEATDKVDLVTSELNYPATLKTGAGEKNATFEATGVSGTVEFVAYPSNLVIPDDGEYMLTLPTSLDNYTSGKIVTPMIGKATTAADGKVSAGLEHLCGLVEVKVSNMRAGINKMVFTAVNPTRTYNGALIMEGSEYSAKEMVAGTDQSDSLFPDMQPNFEFTFNFEAVTEDADMTFYVPVAANTVFSTDGFKVALFNGSTEVEAKTFTLKEAYTVKRANILRNLKFEMTDFVPELEFAEDYSEYSYNWMGGTYIEENKVLSINSNIDWTVSSNREWARPAVNEAGQIVVTLDPNYAPGTRKFTVTITPEDATLASLAKSVTMTETTGWSGGTGWTINEETGAATITGTVTGNSNFNTYYVEVFSGCNMAEFIWNFSEFNITAGNFHVEKYYDGWNMNLNLFANGELAIGANGQSSKINIADKSLTLSDVKSIKILIDGYNNAAWRVFVNNVECIWMNSVGKKGFDIPKANYWTGVQTTTGTVTLESFTTKGWN